MSDSRDALFLRLAVRQEIFSPDDAKQLLAYYREHGGVREGIGHFLVREGYLEEDVASMLSNAIAKRAEGHVSDTRKRVPTLNKTDGARTAHHSGPVRHHAHQRKQSIDGKQAAIFGFSAIVLVVCVVLLIMKMQGTSPAERIAQKQEEGRAAADAAAKAREKQKGSAIAVVPVSASIDELQATVDKIVRKSQECIGDELFDYALDYLKGERQKLVDQNCPGDLLARVDDEIKVHTEQLELQYASLLRRLQKAKGDTASTAEILQQIEDQCGADKLKEARAKIHGS